MILQPAGGYSQWKPIGPLADLEETNMFTNLKSQIEQIYGQSFH